MISPNQECSEPYRWSHFWPRLTSSIDKIWLVTFYPSQTMLEIFRHQRSDPGISPVRKNRDTWGPFIWSSIRTQDLKWGPSLKMLEKYAFLLPKVPDSFWYALSFSATDQTKRIEKSSPVCRWLVKKEVDSGGLVIRSSLDVTEPTETAPVWGNS